MEPAELLKRAIDGNDAAGVALVIETHPELKAGLDEPLPGGSFGQTALLAAVQHQNREMVDALLGAGAVLEIHQAVRLGMLEEVRRMLAETPGLVRARGGDGQLPLHFAQTVEM